MRASDIRSEEWKPVEEAVLCFVRDRDTRQVLLIHKKTGLGAGLINAPGGRIEPGETPLEAAVRETREEVNILVDDLRRRGELSFQFLNGHSIRGYVFEARRWSGEPEQTPEADPFWCDENAVPYDKMWSDDSWWLPHMLAGRRFSGCFVFDGETMLSLSLDIDTDDPADGLAEGPIQGIPRNPVLMSR